MHTHIDTHLVNLWLAFWHMCEYVDGLRWMKVSLVFSSRNGAPVITCFSTLLFDSIPDYPHHYHSTLIRTRNSELFLPTNQCFLLSISKGNCLVSGLRGNIDGSFVPTMEIPSVWRMSCDRTSTDKAITCRLIWNLFFATNNDPTDLRVWMTYDLLFRLIDTFPRKKNKKHTPKGNRMMAIIHTFLSSFFFVLMISSLNFFYLCKGCAGLFDVPLPAPS